MVFIYSVVPFWSNVPVSSKVLHSLGLSILSKFFCRTTADLVRNLGFFFNFKFKKLFLCKDLTKG